MTNNRRSRKVLVLMLTLTLCLTIMPAVYSMSVAEAAVTDAPTDSEDIPWSGKGTETDPYQISSAVELKALSDLVSEGKSFADTYFQMTDDIDLSTECGKTGFDADGNYDGTSVHEKNWRMIGNFVTYNAHNTFSGHFDGQGHTVQNLYYNTPYEFGALFGYLSGGVIENLTVSGSVSQASGAGLVNYAGNETIRNCVNHVTVNTTRNNAAGILLTAEAGVVISGCSNYGKIGAVDGYAGGIIAQPAVDTQIEDCTNYGAISTNGIACGGISGNTKGNLSGCINRGTVSCAGSMAYGIGGSVVTDCYNTGTVTASRNNSNTGYLAFGITQGRGKSDQVVNCYNIGTVVSDSSGFSEIDCGGSFPICYAADEETNASLNCYYLENCAGVSREGFTFAGLPKTAGELQGLAETLGSSYMDDPGINNGYPILNREGEGAVKTVTFEWTSPVSTTVLNVNDQTLQSGDSIRVPAGGTVTFKIEGFNTGLYKVDSVFLNDTDRLTPGADGRCIFTAEEDTNVRITVVTKDSSQVQAGDNGNTLSGVKASGEAWNGRDVDVRWYIGHENDPEYRIDTPAELAGVAALVNGLVNEDCVVSVSDTRTYPASEWNQSIGSYVFKSETDGSGGNGLNMSTDTYHYGIEDFHEKTIVLTENLDMGGIYNENTDQWSGPNYMPVGGQYLMKKNDSSTKLSSSFCGTFDGNGHYVLNVYCDRHCSNGNFGDGQSVGLIGRLGVHDNDPAELRPVNPTVKNVGVTGYLYSNRSVGGIVGKTGKTAYNNGTEGGWSLIQNCVNYARVIGTDAKGTGGVVGAFWNGGRMENCYNAGHVTGGWPAGGVASSNENTMVNCYNVGTVDSASGDNWAMSLGTNNGGAPMKAVTNCWYLDGSAPGGGYFTSSKPENSGAMTAEEMKSETFVTTLGDAFNKDTGHINNGYPILKWQGGTKPEDHDLICPSKAFTDLDTSKWYHEAIDYVLLKNYFNGVGDGKFEPDGTMTRAMFVTVLGRAAGVEEDKNAHSSFGDVADGKWYTAYVDWAAKNGIVNGYNSETFGTDDFVTREQMAAILYRYAIFKKVDTSGADAAKFNDFKDKDSVSGWSVEAMTWATGSGLINGMGDGRLAPKNTATRAQVAQLLMNFDQKLA